ncbi:hypothetical protein FNV43_RR04504 [Rhamnella rubrinervis]|uniref:Uncharacterized protein n=1 Tax=Rhamnella rubrinervis TaxID=2594499 RepID=A0A8K0MPU5_9ROSA|nr:hypothetical protein FNV43_RR04504 [Rhamnella rubrinervis]
MQNQLLEVKEKPKAEGLKMTIDEIFDNVLLPKSGLGPGPKSISKQSLLDKIRAYAHAYFHNKGLNVDMPDWLQANTNNDDSINEGK